MFRKCKRVDLFKGDSPERDIDIINLRQRNGILTAWNCPLANDLEIKQVNRHNTTQQFMILNFKLSYYRSPYSFWWV